MRRSSSRTVEFTITDSDTGLAIDLSTVVRLLIFIYQDGKKIIDKFAYPNTTGYTEINVTNAAAGICEVYLNKSDTRDALNKKLFAEVNLDINDSNFEDNTATLIESDLELEEVEDSITRSL